MTTLIAPDATHLPGYAAALRRGWSPSTTRDLSGAHLAAMAEDAPGLLHRLNRTEAGSTTGPSGETLPNLPGTTRWIWGAGFCGAINLRYQHGSTALPPTVSGHIGYSVVPWQQRQGHATAALRVMLPIAAAIGLPYVIVTCNTENAGSRKVIEANGGSFLHEADDNLAPGTRKRVYRIELI